ncbi:ABC transporter permease [Marmoricola sp. Leaf446]|uniref:ABC transporter permease n=1 Tax=Marmoricola sp. Leaf446 TaxID=1736379 RepID=UPI000AA0D641|nr:ABC transporter permease [Marmoricola sp. Leaf446]
MVRTTSVTAEEVALSTLEEPGHAMDPEAVVVGERNIEGRSLSQIAWGRLRKDKVALTGAFFIVFLVTVALLAPLIVKVTGGPPDEYHQDLLDMALGGVPNGFFGGMSWAHPMGLEVGNGRDIFSRVLYGARISLLIAILATTVSVVIGTVVGVVAGFFGGWVDAVLSRVMDVFLAFPLLVFAIALSGVFPNEAFGLEGLPLRLALLVFVIGFFNWPYIGRIVRGQTLSLREREYVEAARSLGARRPYILFTELLPNLIAPILVYATLTIPTNILFEAALSFLGVGVPPPTASWGEMLSSAVDSYTALHFMFWPGLAIFLTVLAFNLFGDGLRDAFDPKSSR